MSTLHELAEEWSWTERELEAAERVLGHEAVHSTEDGFCEVARRIAALRRVAERDAERLEHAASLARKRQGNLAESGKEVAARDNETMADVLAAYADITRREWGLEEPDSVYGAKEDE